MAYEELPPPAFILPFPLELDRDGIVDFTRTVYYEARVDQKWATHTPAAFDQ